MQDPVQCGDEDPVAVFACLGSSRCGSRLMRVVTSGSAYLDVDAYACCIAYAELLSHQGVDARAVSSAPLNASISRTVLGWQSSLDDYLPRAGDEFVLVDVSDYHHFDPVVVLEQVVEVIDHHPGFENYWVQKLGSTADILPIGAAATLIFQRWEAAGLLPLISRKSAALLATAILDNILNLTGQLTTQLDIRAYEVLARRAKLEADWPERYFLECQATIESDLTGAWAVDIKRLKADSNLPQVFAQMAVWDASALRGAGQASCAVPASPQSTPASLGFIADRGDWGMAAVLLCLVLVVQITISLMGFRVVGARTT